MAFNFARLNAELRADMSPQQLARLEALEAQQAHRDANTVYVDGVERFHYSNGAFSYERIRRVGFVVEPSPFDPAAMCLVCTNGITGYESWEIRGLRSGLEHFLDAGRTDFYVCGGTNGRYASLTVKIQDVLGLIKECRDLH